MTDQESPAFWRRLLTALGGTLKHGILGKSSHDHMKQFTCSDEYWDRVIAAQLGWPQKQPAKSDPDRKNVVLQWFPELTDGLTHLQQFLSLHA
jgi:hypothetical protein